MREGSQLLESSQVLHIPGPATLRGVRTHQGDLNASEKEREKDRGRAMRLVETGGSGSNGFLSPGCREGCRSVCLLERPVLDEPYMVKTDPFCWGPEGLVDYYYPQPWPGQNCPSHN